MQEFLDGLDKPRRGKLVATIKLLEEQGPALPFPYSSQVQGKLRELRAHYGSEHFRILYFGAPNRAFVLSHALEKRTEKLPGRDIKLAEKRMGKYLERLENE